MGFTNREADIRLYIPPSSGQGFCHPRFHGRIIKVNAEYYILLSENHSDFSHIIGSKKSYVEETC